MRHPGYSRALEAAHAAGSGRGNWLDVARTAMEFLDGDQACFLCFDKQGGTVLAMDSFGHDDKVLKDYADYYYQFDDVTRQGYDLPAGAWLDARADQKRTAKQDQMYWSDFLRANRISQISAFSVHNDGVMMAAVSVHIERQRNWSDRQLMQMRAYRKALCDAFARRRAMAEASVGLMQDVLQCDDETYCVVSNLGPVMMILPGGMEMLSGDSELVMANRVLSHRHPTWHRRLKEAIHAAGLRGRAECTLPNGWGRFYRLSMKRLDSALSLGLDQAVGVRIERRDIFAVPSAALLMEMFLLTPAEAALCHSLVAGHSVKDCAALLGVAEATARKQLASIFQKTSCNRQSELIRLVSGLPL